MANRPRGRETLGDMIRSMALLVLPVLGLLALITVVPEDDENINPVDWQPILAQAREAAPYQVLAPVGIPEGPGQWMARHARWTTSAESIPDDVGGNHWMLAFLDPGRTYIALHQTDAPALPTMQKLTREGVRDGEQQIGGRTWEQRVSPDDRTRALVWQDGEVITVVVGDTGYEQLAAFVSTLTTGD
ncbi:DUF4245 domain-containing protein [Enemella sp. A6]|uniref:DUF4245 domain-containing protein n=1 Tax=Enemella sp. A6 TaxID=3440152 RepID=UPI003EB9A0B0